MLRVKLSALKLVFASLILLWLPLNVAIAKKNAALMPPPIRATVLPASNGMVPDMMLGDPNAKITVIGYVSASCPHCGHWYKTVYPYIEATYIRTGKIKFIFRESMAPQKQYAMSAYLIGRCLTSKNVNKNDASPYFTVIDAFFDEQENFYNTGRVTSALNAVALRTGQSLSTISGCIGDEAAWNAITQSSDDHMDADNITQVPTFIVNGKRVQGQERSDFDAAIQAATKLP